MINLPKIAFVARLCLLLIIAFAVAWLLISSITVAPRLDETFQRFSNKKNNHQLSSALPT